MTLTRSFPPLVVLENILHQNFLSQKNNDLKKNLNIFSLIPHLIILKCRKLKHQLLRNIYILILSIVLLSKQCTKHQRVDLKPQDLGHMILQVALISLKEELYLHWVVPCIIAGQA
jgi:hypothetical protein